MVETTCGVGRDERHRRADLGEMRELGEPVPGQAHDGHRARAQQAEQCDGELRGVGQLDQHTVAGADAQARDTCRGAVGEAVEFGVRVPVVRIDHRDVVRPCAGRRPQHRIQ